MARPPVFKISFANATMLSALYLLLAASIEGVRRQFGFVWAERAALSMESFPARMLDAVGLYEPLRRAWVNEAVSDIGVRVIYGLTVVGLIFALGLLVASAMWVLQLRTQPPPTPPPVE